MSETEDLTVTVENITGWVRYTTGGNMQAYAKVDPNFPASHRKAWDHQMRRHVSITQEDLDTWPGVKPVRDPRKIAELEEEARTYRQTTRVYFQVLTTGPYGDEDPSWAQAVEIARGKIQRFEHPGGHVNPRADDYHPLRHREEGGMLVVYSRAFVELRIKGPRGDRPVITWEVFNNGTVEEISRGER